jgi:hypothetical protein
MYIASSSNRSGAIHLLCINIKLHAENSGDEYRIKNLDEQYTIVKNKYIAPSLKKSDPSLEFSSILCIKLLNSENWVINHRISYPVGQYKFKEIKRQNWEEKWDKKLNKSEVQMGQILLIKTRQWEQVFQMVSIFWHVLNIVCTL